VASALIIVDVQHDFLPGGALPVPDGHAVIDRINALVDSGAFDVVIATRDWHPADHVSFAGRGGPWPVHCVAGTPGAEIHSGIDQSRVDAIISKGESDDGMGYSGFETGELAQVLREEGVTAVTVVGLATDFCVKATALDALAEGLVVTVDPLAVRGVDVEPGDAERALDELRGRGVVVAETGAAS
jgi:nicotinamidase/pyrazinamidase